MAEDRTTRKFERIVVKENRRSENKTVENAKDIF